jgi:hypothetical protein
MKIKSRIDDEPEITTAQVALPSAGLCAAESESCRLCFFMSLDTNGMIASIIVSYDGLSKDVISASPHVDQFSMRPS